MVLNTSLDGYDINLLIKLTGMYEIPQLLYDCSNTYVYVRMSMHIAMVNGIGVKTRGHGPHTFDNFSIEISFLPYKDDKL